MYIKKSIITCVIIMTVLATHAVQKKSGSVKSSVKEIEIDLAHNIKNISTALAGYDAEDFATGVDFNWMLTKARKKLIDNFNQAGVKCLRFATCGRYSFRGELQTRAMRSMGYARNNPEFFKKLMKRKLKWWFKPEDFFSLCKIMDIKIIGMFDTRAFWNEKKQCAQWSPDCNDSDLRQAAKENAAFVQWLKDNDYLQLFVGWELGSEPWYAGRMSAAQYAKYARYTIEETRAIDPNIQFAVPAFICSSDYPELKTVAARVKGADPEYNTSEYKGYRYALDWTTEVFKRLGSKLKLFKWAKIHTYGTSTNYNSNYYGLKRHYLLLQSQPNAKHLRLMNTEWRFTAGDKPSGHRKFRIGALWNAKFLMQMVAFPKMDYSGAHSLFCFSGGLYYSDGEKWVLQQVGPGFWQKGLPRFIPADSPKKQPDIALGSFGPVVKMTNQLITRTPYLVNHGADNGILSASKFFSADTRDVQWLIATDKNRKSIGALFVNTNKKPIKILLKIKGHAKKVFIRDAMKTVLTCQNNMTDVYEIPGTPLWTVRKWIGSGKNIELPPESVSYFWISLKK
jgi:hypothetical protein